VDSKALAAPVDSEKVNENGVGADWEIVTETPSIGDALMQKNSQPLLTKKKSTKTESVQTWKSSPKHLPKVTRGFGSSQPLLTQKKSTKQLLKITRGFDSAHSPCDSQIVNEN
jgi:hypothetical protein